MSNEADFLRSTYERSSYWYHRIDDFRAKLLGFLPFISGTGIFLLLDTDISARFDYNFLALLGTMGFSITLGLFFYELRGVQRCIRITKVSAEIERRMNVPGPFGLQPKSMGGFVNEPVAAAIVYPAVLTAWALVATTYSSWQEPAWLPYSIGVGAFGSALAFFLYYRKDNKFQADLDELLATWAKTGGETKQTTG